MSTVIFLRAVNVGGHQPLRPKAIADALGLVNVGAAGTFVAADGRSAASLGRAVREALPFDTEVLVRPGAEVLRLLAAAPFGDRIPGGARRFVSILAATPKTRPALPLERPEGKPWEVRVVAVEGRWALSLRLARGPRTLYSNAVVEKALGVSATTRGWDTLEAVGEALRGAPPPRPR